MPTKPTFVLIEGAAPRLGLAGDEPPYPPGGSGSACLVAIYGSAPGRKYDVEDDELTIGRAQDNAISVDAESISRAHATVSRDAGGIKVRDLGSTNGTYVNDEQIDEAYLQDGDLIRVGRSIFKFMDGSDIERSYHEEIYRLSTVDGLTQVFNRRYFVETLERELSRARRVDMPLCLLMFDLDHFKRCNDEHTHEAGDDLLRRIAELVRERSREIDVVARYGGEEFAVILPEMPLERATAFAETLRALIEETEFSFEDRQIPMTISVGVTARADGDATANALIERADLRVQAAKDAGRNRVVAG